MGKTRLYTHTLNGSARTASTWGRFLGRWGTKVLGRLAIIYTIYDYTKNVAIPMSKGSSDYIQENRKSGDWIANLPH